MIRETYYKDRPAVEISDGKITALFLPQDGGKLISIKDSIGRELLAQTIGKKYLRLNMNTSFVKSECSAFDDMFPTIDPCLVGEMQYPDHGEISRVPLCCRTENDNILLYALASSCNAQFSKRAYIDDGKLYIAYKIENKNDFKLPYLWAGHIMLVGEEGVKVVNAFDSSEKITVAFGQLSAQKNILGAYGSGKEYKYYYDSALVPMSCSAEYPISKRKVNISFIGDAVKYLAIWMNPGDLNGMYNLGIEPCTAPYDTPINAEKAGKCSYIEAFGKVEFTLKISYENEGE